MPEIVPRWEWRWFGHRFGPAESRLATLTPSAVQESSETYLLSGTGDNVKVRDALMDIKVLRETRRDGLEQWTPVMKAGFPLPAAEVAKVFAALRHAIVAAERLPQPAADAELVGDGQRQRLQRRQLAEQLVRLRQVGDGDLLRDFEAEPAWIDPGIGDDPVRESLVGVSDQVIEVSCRVRARSPGNLEVHSHEQGLVNPGRILLGDQPIEFTYLEYTLFSFLVTHPNRVYSREVLLNRVWGTDYYGGARTVDVHVRRVRSKLGPEVARRLETVRNVGYLWKS